MKTCPMPDELLMLIGEALPERDCDRVMGHIELCPRCQTALEAMAGSERSWEDTSESLKRNAGEEGGRDDGAGAAKPSERRSRSRPRD